ncbi:sigma-70 family RNA polymerase sigma factor [Dyella psychrodurans]|uniref:RNA polymerase sigma factor n=1 Tax=Dyella psychrodurans TaxID=1927960 RepID=A0A370XF41_9GAMM|nr:sigma-70 family RNA polymerase sigma factor [Dyella psychrodurans]RDS86875.1 RNA polymerase sigma factor [Dyella psychrodurans]
MHDIDDDELRTLLPQLRRFALGLTRDAHAADDLVQSCMEKALVKWHSRMVGGNLYGWLCSILYRQFIDGKRHSARLNRWLDCLHEEPELAPSPEDTWQARTSLSALEELPPDQRAVLLLVSVDGMSYQDIAATLDVPIGTVMSRLSRARKAFRSLTDGGVSQPALRIAR